MKRPCRCNRAIAGAPLDKFDDSVPAEQKQCVFCWNALNSLEYRKLWGLQDDGEPLTMDAVRKLPNRGCCPGTTENGNDQSHPVS